MQLSNVDPYSFTALYLGMVYELFITLCLWTSKSLHSVSSGYISDSMRTPYSKKEIILYVPKVYSGFSPLKTIIEDLHDFLDEHNIFPQEVIIQ